MNHILHVPVPYPAQVRYGRSRDSSERLMRRDLPVSIREVEPERAPVALTIKGRTRAPFELAWRAVDGKLFRPLLGPDGTSVSLAGFPDVVAAALAAGHYAQPWDDYPLTWKQRSFQAAQAGIENLHRDNAKLVSDSWAEVSAAAARKAEAELVVIEGVLFKEAPAPVWSPASGSAAIRYGLHRLSLIIPDFETPSAIRFRADQVDQAREFSLTLARRAAEFPPGTQAPEERDLEVDPGEVEILAPEMIADPRADSFKATAECIRYAIAPSSLEDTDFELLAAYVDLYRAGQAISLQNPSEADIAAGDAALSGYLNAYRRFGKSEWLRGAQSQEFALAMLTMNEVLDRHEPDADADLTTLGI